MLETQQQHALRINGLHYLVNDMSPQITHEHVEELKRIKRVSDLLTSAHAVLRDRYGRWALILDIVLLGLSVWLTAMVFVEPRIGLQLSPPGIDKEISIGLIAIGSFFLTLIQMRVDWRGKADIHSRVSTTYSAIKLECTHLLSRVDTLIESDYGRFLERYLSIGEYSVPIPEAKFNKLKKQHLIKVEISKLLSNHPGASITLLRLKLWWRDNF